MPGSQFETLCNGYGGVNHCWPRLSSSVCGNKFLIAFDVCRDTWKYLVHWRFSNKFSDRLTRLDQERWPQNNNNNNKRR